MRIAIYGAGSLGIVLGAYISRAGTQVDLFNRNRVHVEALRAQGASVVGNVTFCAPVNAFYPQEIQGLYDVIFLLTKQQQNEETVTFLKPHLKEDGVLCTLQNGLPEPAIAHILGEERVLGCTVAWGATLSAPGTSALTSDPASMSFGLGRLKPVHNDTRLQRVSDILSCMCPVEIEENFMGVRWSKLLINAAFSGLSTVFGRTFGEVATQKETRVYAQLVIKECIDVARAAGIRIAPVQGKDIAALFDYSGPIKKWVSFLLIPIAMKKHADIKASMWQDLEKGKQTEIDFINGVVCAYGQTHGVPTPCNDKIVELIKGMEAGQYAPSLDNLRLLPAAGR